MRPGRGLFPEFVSVFNVHPLRACYASACGRGEIGPILEDMEIEGTAPAVALSATERVSRAGALIMSAQLRLVRRHEQAVRGGDAGPVHDMRVATRRLRADFALFEASYRRRDRAGLKKGLRRLGARLGEVRDMDVLLSETRAAADTLPAADLNGFLAHLEERRASGRVELLSYLDSPGYHAWQSRFVRFLEQHGAAVDLATTDVAGNRGSGSQSDARDRAIAPSRICELLPAEIWKRYGGVRAYAPVVATASPDRLHALRIAGKRLRYTLEAFEGLFGPEVRALLRPLRQMQESLGAMHDAEVLIGLLLAFDKDAGPSDRVQPAINEERGFSLEARAQFDRIWPAIIDESFRSGLATAVAAL